MLDLDRNSGVADDSSFEMIRAEFVARAWTTFVDHVAASITGLFESRGIDSILLKGAAFARLFYGDGSDRYYSDTDLLVATDHLDIAEKTLRESGFERVDRDEDWLGPEPKYAHTFHRSSDEAVVDLHWSLSGATVSPKAVWTAVRPHTAKVEVSGRLVDALDGPASALLVALHSAHHGNGREITLSDLDRAAVQLDIATWLDAVCLADQLGAARPFAAGLRLTETGDAVADRLGLDRPASVEMWLKTNRSNYGAWVLDRLSQTSTIRGRAQICLQVAIPPRVVMYRFFPLARRGPVGLTLAYVVRPVRLAVHAGPALRDWFRARRTLRA